jgi:hypothetical protein
MERLLRRLIVPLSDLEAEGVRWCDEILEKSPTAIRFPRNFGSHVAIAAGISDGLGFGDNAKSALLSRGLAEITRLGLAMGASPDTFFGVAGVGVGRVSAHLEFRVVQRLNQPLHGPIADGVGRAAVEQERVWRRKAQPSRCACTSAAGLTSLESRRTPRVHALPDST